MDEPRIEYQKARARVEALKDFYIHLVVYVVINLFLLVLNLIVSPATLWFYWPLLGWGIAVGLHALSTYGGIGRLLGADWEEKKIREVMEREESS